MRLIIFSLHKCRNWYMVQCLNFVVQNIISQATGKGSHQRIVAHTMKCNTERKHWMQVKHYRSHFKIVGRGKQIIHMRFQVVTALFVKILSPRMWCCVEVYQYFGGDGGSMFLQNSGKPLPAQMISHPRLNRAISVWWHEPAMLFHLRNYSRPHSWFAFFIARCANVAVGKLLEFPDLAILISHFMNLISATRLTHLITSNAHRVKD
jgi:hypothetical protein